VKCYRSDIQLMKNGYAPDSDLVLITRSLLDIHVTSSPLRVRISGHGVKSNCMVCARLRSTCKCKNRTVSQRQRNSKGLWRRYNWVYRAFRLGRFGGRMSYLFSSYPEICIHYYQGSLILTIRSNMIRQVSHGTQRTGDG